MYEEFYKLKACPFRLTPDTRYYFNSDSHKNALSYLQYGLRQEEGFIVITGCVGTGKSTLINYLFSQMDHTSIIPAHIGITHLESDDIIRTICAAFFINCTSNHKADLLAEFERFLVEQHRKNRRVLLVVDEVQNLPVQALEELRMLSNISLGNTPLFQVFLVGQPQFLSTISHPDLQQLRQRIIALYNLESLSEKEMHKYIQHRLEKSGWKNDPTFNDTAMQSIYDYTLGVPRQVNTLCNRILLHSALNESHEITKKDVEEVFADKEKEFTNKQLGKAQDSFPEPQQNSLQNEYSPFSATEEIIRVFSSRIEKIEATLIEHERALQELLDVAIGHFATDDFPKKTSKETSKETAANSLDTGSESSTCTQHQPRTSTG
jgi:putative secretion ATPase (PEP-CTERM system associated)